MISNFIVESEYISKTRKGLNISFDIGSLQAYICLVLVPMSTAEPRRVFRGKDRLRDIQLTVEKVSIKVGWSRWGDFDPSDTVLWSGESSTNSPRYSIYNGVDSLSAVNDSGSFPSAGDALSHD